MASRVAYRYMKQAGIMSNIFNIFTEPSHEKKKMPLFDVAKVWVTSGMYGTTLGEVSRELKLKGEDTAILNVNGRQAKLSLYMERVKMKDDGGIKGDTFVVVSLTGVKENIPKRELDLVLKKIMRETRLKDIFTSIPVVHPNRR